MADMNGYMNKFEVYQGNGQKTTDETKTKYFGLGDGVVYEITKSLQGKYHKVCVDNYFTSVSPIECLFSSGFMLWYIAYQ